MKCTIDKCKLDCLKNANYMKIIFQTNEGERNPLSIGKHLYKQQQERQQRDLANEFGNKGIFDTLPECVGKYVFSSNAYYILFISFYFLDLYGHNVSPRKCRQWSRHKRAKRRSSRNIQI